MGFWSNLRRVMHIISVILRHLLAHLAELLRRRLIELAEQKRRIVPLATKARRPRGVSPPSSARLLVRTVAPVHGPTLPSCTPIHAGAALT